MGGVCDPCRVHAELPSEHEVNRAKAALTPFVFAWDLPLNPEDVGEMAWAVLLHQHDGLSMSEIDAAVEVQIAQFDAAKRESYASRTPSCTRPAVSKALDDDD